MSGLRKAINLSFQEKKKTKISTDAILEKARTMEQLKSQWLPGVCRRWYTEYQKFSYEGENTLNDIKMMDVY